MLLKKRCQKPEVGNRYCYIRKAVQVTKKQTHLHMGCISMLNGTIRLANVHFKIIGRSRGQLL